MKPLSPARQDVVYKLIFGLLVISIFFPVRYVFKLPNNFVTGAYSDFTSFSLYSCDLLLIGLFIFSTIIRAYRERLGKLLIGFIIWLIFIFLINFKREIGLNMYFFFKILELIILHETFKNSKLGYRELFVKLFVILGALESVLAMTQFLYQRSVGLYFIGEQHISPLILGIAKIALNMTKFVRGYGTFPHPNLLSAFLLVAIILSTYLITIEQLKIKRIFVSILLIINIFGLIISFSRAALFAALITLIVFLAMSSLKTGTRKIFLPALIVILTLATSFFILKPFLLARTDLATDQSAKERIFYTRIGLKIIKNHPLIGVGMGTSVLHMEQYSPIKLQTWEIQPIHNYYLLAAAELGIVGALILITLFLSYLKNLFKLLKDFSSYRLSLLCILIGFLILMMFDHYFYTIEQTQFLLWMILGLIAAEISSAKRKSA